MFAANLNRLFGALALKALAVYAIPTPSLHQDATTLLLYSAYPAAGQACAAEEAALGATSAMEHQATTTAPPQPAYGHNKDGHPDLKQVLLSLGVSGDGGIPLRFGLRDGNTSDSTETPGACAECLALGLNGVMGIVADSKA